MPKIDTVIKLGGSLITQKKIYQKILNELIILVNLGFKILLIPGGGILSDHIRTLYKNKKITDEAAHWMAILCMDQMAHLLANNNKKITLINNIDEGEKVLNENKLPILLVYNYLKNNDELPHKWDVTSDSISAFIALKLNSSKLILIKDVDGLYSEDPKLKNNANFISKIKISEFNVNKYNIVDAFLPEILKLFLIKGKCWLVNGIYPKRVNNIIQDINEIHTELLI